MDKNEFKKLLNDALVSNGLVKKGKYYYKESSETICVVGLQKSNFSNAYYINLGIVIKELNLSLQNPRDVDGDIRSRFSFKSGDRLIDYIDLDESINSDYLVSSIEANIDELINSSTSLDGVKELLKRDSTLLYQTKINAKKYLGFE